MNGQEMGEQGRSWLCMESREHHLIPSLLVMDGEAVIFISFVVEAVTRTTCLVCGSFPCLALLAQKLSHSDSIYTTPPLIVMSVSTEPKPWPYCETGVRSRHGIVFVYPSPSYHVSATSTITQTSCVANPSRSFASFSISMTSRLFNRANTQRFPYFRLRTWFVADQTETNSSEKSN